MIRTVGLVAKYEEPKAAEMTSWLVPWLKERGKQVLVESGVVRAGGRSCSKEEMARKADLIILVGLPPPRTRSGRTLERGLRALARRGPTGHRRGPRSFARPLRARAAGAMDP